MISAKNLQIGPINTAPTPQGEDAQPAASPSSSLFWAERGFLPHQAQDGTFTGTIPEGVIAISGDTLVKPALTQLVRHLNGPPCVTVIDSTTSYFFRVEAGFPPAEAIPVPAGIAIATAGSSILLPADIPSCTAFRASTAQDIPLIDAGHDWYRLSPPTTMPELQDTPLAALSLRGQAEAFELAVTAPTPLLGTMCLAGQSTLIYAPPNGGKTATVLRLLLDAVQAGRIAAGNVYYVNADDNSAGFAIKLRLTDDLGVHTLCPGFNGFKADEFGPKLAEMGRRRKAAGTLTIIDTTKKFVDLMSKKEASQFAHACRQYVMGGGAIVALAHTNKNATASGKLTYAGTTDMLEDFDAAYIGTPLQGGIAGKEKVIKFEALKLRGPGATEVAYAFSSGPCDSYEQLLASVREVDPEQLEDFERQDAEVQDADVIAHVEWCIGNGIAKKMELAKAVAERANVSQKAALRVIEGYTGTDPKSHRWSYKVRERGAKVFELLIDTADPGDDI